MRYDPDRHQRRSIRLKGYDYSQPGAYFVTICVNRRECLFGDVVDGQMRLNQYGVIVAEEWQRSSVIRTEIELDAWVVMPNHFHGIVIINKPVGSNGNVGANGDAKLILWAFAPTGWSWFAPTG